MSNPFDSDKETDNSEHKVVEHGASAGLDDLRYDPFRDVLKEQEKEELEVEEEQDVSLASEGITSIDLLSLTESPRVERVQSVLDLEFDTSKQVELFEDENSCPICFEIFCSKPPRIVVDCPLCHKSFCRGCLERIHKDRTNGTCPFCRQAFEWSAVERNYEKEQTVAHFPGYCVKCNKQMARGELPEHEANCSPLEVQCSPATKTIATVSTTEDIENSW